MTIYTFTLESNEGGKGTVVLTEGEGTAIAWLLAQWQTECICRTSTCGHAASFHTGPDGACVICKTGCWS